MPSEEYCQDLANDINEKIDDWLDAYDDMRDAESDLIDSAEEEGQSFVDTLIHGIFGDFGDAASEGSHYPVNDAARERAGAKLDRALDKLDRLKDKIDAADKKWCDECGDPPEDEDSAPVEEIDFTDEEGTTITDHTRTGWE